MKTRIAALAILLTSLGFGFGLTAAHGTDSPVLSGDDTEWFCVWVYATDTGYCQDNPLPPELPIPPAD